LPDLSGTIETAAGRPQAASVDGLTVTGRSVLELIQADQYLAAKAAASKRRRGIRFSKAVNPGALSDAGGTLGGTSDFGTPGGW